MKGATFSIISYYKIEGWCMMYDGWYGTKAMNNDVIRIMTKEELYEIIASDEGYRIEQTT